MKLTLYLFIGSVVALLRRAGDLLRVRSGYF